MSRVRHGIVGRATAIAEISPIDRVTAMVGILTIIAMVTTTTIGLAAQSNADASTGALDVWPPTLLVALPAGDPPDSGWPVMVMLHGYGVNKDDFDEVIVSLAEHGAAVIAIDAPQDLGAGRRQWGAASSAHATHAYLRTELAPLTSDTRFDWSTIHLGGFSQGAIHSIFLVLAHPETYGSVLAISPAGGNFPATWDAGEQPHRLFLVVGDAEHGGIARSVSRAQDLWTATGQDVRVHRHPGGHQFPPHWPTVLGDALEWLLDAAENPVAPRDAVRGGTAP